MKNKNLLLATTAILMALQPAFSGIAVSQTGPNIIVAQSEDLAATLNQALAELAAAQEALSEATASGGDVEAAQARVSAAQQAAEEAQAAFEASKIQQEQTPEPEQPAEEQPSEENQPDSEQKEIEEAPAAPAQSEETQKGQSAETDAPVKEEEPAAPTASEEKAPEKNEQAAPAPTSEQPVEQQPVENDQPAVEQKEVDEIPTTEEQKEETQPEQTEKQEAPVEEEAPTAPATSEEKPADASPSAETKTEEKEQAAPSSTSEQPAAQQPAEKVEPKAEQPASNEVESPAAIQETNANPAEVKALPVEEQLKAAPNNPITVLPEEITKEEKAAVEAAEAQRRKDSRKRRNELLGAAAVGAAVGALVPILGGKLVEDQGDRIIIENDGDYFVRRDENALLRDPEVTFEYQELRDGSSREVATRPDGVQIVTLRGPNGDILQRERILPDGSTLVLIDNVEYAEAPYVDYDEQLPPLEIVDLASGDYIVSVRDAEPVRIRETFLAPPVEVVEKGYSLRDIRRSKRIRDTLRRLDLDTVTFDTGSATVRQSQVPQLQSLASAIADVINENPAAIFLIEGHTDAVGSELSNLALSDRRAEAIARILIKSYGIPAENLVVEGYGEAYLKVPTQGDEPQNRRVAVRNITPLLNAQKR